MSSASGRDCGRAPPARFGRVVALAALTSLLGACAFNTGTVVLLPEKDGRNAAVTVTQADRALVLDRPYAAARRTRIGPYAYTSDPREVEALFGAALAAQPLRPTAYTLFFVEGGDELTAESLGMIESMLSEIARYPVPDIVVVGHTDRVGSDEYNDALALRRAETMRKTLIDRGIAPENVIATGRGKRELLVPTADGVAEPRNRRVEIIVR